MNERDLGSVVDIYVQIAQRVWIRLSTTRRTSLGLNAIHLVRADWLT